MSLTIGETGETPPSICLTLEQLMTKQQREEYWDVVQTCLKEIFHSDIDARQQPSYPYSMRKRNILYFHEEPLYVAARIAGREATEEETKLYIEKYQ